MRASRSFVLAKWRAPPTILSGGIQKTTTGMWKVGRDSASGTVTTKRMYWGPNQDIINYYLDNIKNFDVLYKEDMMRFELGRTSKQELVELIVGLEPEQVEVDMRIYTPTIDHTPYLEQEDVQQIIQYCKSPPGEELVLVDKLIILDRVQNSVTIKDYYAFETNIYTIPFHEFQTNIRRQQRTIQETVHNYFGRLRGLALDSIIQHHLYSQQYIVEFPNDTYIQTWLHFQGPMYTAEELQRRFDIKDWEIMEHVQKTDFKEKGWCQTKDYLDHLIKRAVKREKKETGAKRPVVEYETDQVRPKTATNKKKKKGKSGRKKLGRGKLKLPKVPKG
jgi:hypothetical protein